MKTKETSYITIILENGNSVDLEFPEEVFDEIIVRLENAMKFCHIFSMSDYCDKVYMKIGDENISTLNGSKIIGYNY